MVATTVRVRVQLYMYNVHFTSLSMPNTLIPNGGLRKKFAGNVVGVTSKFYVLMPSLNVKCSTRLGTRNRSCVFAHRTRCMTRRPPTNLYSSYGNLAVPARRVMLFIFEL